MVTESIAIIVITLFMIVLFFRSVHADYAVCVAPILVVPSVHLAVQALVYYDADGLIFNAPYQFMLAFADIVALAITCVLFVTCAMKIKRVATKRVYIILLVGYSVLLTCAYVFQTLQPLMYAYLIK